MLTAGALDRALHRDALRRPAARLLERYDLRRHRRARWSGSAASARGPGSSCCSAATTGDPLFLQAKEAGAVGARAASLGRASTRNHGQRVVAGQRLMQAASDIFLGWVAGEGRSTAVARDFYVRQLRDWKVSVDDRPRWIGGRAGDVRRVCAAGPWRAPTRARATGSRSPPTSATADASTRRSPSSPSATPIRTSATTRRCARR